ncbi:MAG: hypothetical protein V4636_17830 [Pseudomonadota bacterium]
MTPFDDSDAEQTEVRCVLMRGGTSKALFFPCRRSAEVGSAVNDSGVQID